MTPSKPDGSASERGERGNPVRQRVLDGAERLLRRGKAGFSMRDLATEAGVSFATPFNHFGSKTGIMHALSRRRIDAMAERFGAAPRPRDLMARVELAVSVAAAVMLEEPDVNRAVMSAIGTAGPETGEALARSAAYWAMAIGDRTDGVSLEQASDANLPRQLALAFRGALSFWTAAELPDAALEATSRDVARALARDAQA